MEKWEYKVIFEPFYKNSFESLFNKLGEEGWEMVSLGTIRWNIGEFASLFVFKRKKREEESKKPATQDEKMVFITPQETYGSLATNEKKTSQSVERLPREDEFGDPWAAG